MTERVRRRTSKWDLQEDSEKNPVGTRQDNVQSGKASESIEDNGSVQEWNVSKTISSRNTMWSEKNSDSAFRSEGNSRRSCLEPPSGNRAETKHYIANRSFNGASGTMRTGNENRSYSTSMSPGLDGWRQRSRSRSPKRGWSKSHRSRSRSPSHRLRSRSRSPPYRPRSRSRSPPYRPRSRSGTPPQHFRSRSRSPLHGLKREPEGWNDRVRGVSRVSLCNDFARGRCRRGSQCRFLHQENNGYEDRRPPDSVPAQNWESKHEKGGSYGHPNHVDWDHSRDKLSLGHESQRNFKSSDSCINFLKGNCLRGSSCRFLHENSVIDGRGASGRTHERDIKSYSERDHRRGPYRSSIPCKYFAAGNCRRGVSCNFSHEDPVHDRPEGAGTSADGKLGHGLGDEKKSWVGPKWSEEGTDSAHGSAEGKSLNYGSGHIPNNPWDQPSWNKKPTWNDDQAVDGRPEARSADERRSRGLTDDNKSWGKSEAKPGDEMWGHNFGEESKSWKSPKWGGEAAVQTNGVEGGSLNEGRDHHASSGWDDPRWMEQSIIPARNDEAAAAAPRVKKPSRWGDADNTGQVGGTEEIQRMGGANWSDNTTAASVVTTSAWRNDRNDVAIPAPQPSQGSIEDRTNYNMDNEDRTWGVPRWTDKPSDEGGNKSPPRGVDNNGANMGAQLPGSNEEMPNFTRTEPAGAERHQYPHLTDDEKSRCSIQDSQSRLQAAMHSHEQATTQAVSCQHAHPMNPEGQSHPASTAMIYPAASSMNAESQHTQKYPASTAMIHLAPSSMNAEIQQTQKYPASPVMLYPAASSMNAESQQKQKYPASTAMIHPAPSSMNAESQQTQKYPASTAMIHPPPSSMNAESQQTQMYPASIAMIHPAPSSMNAESQQTQKYPSSTAMIHPDPSSMNAESQPTQKYPASPVMVYPFVSSMNAQNQQALPAAAPRARSFDLNGPVEDLPSPNRRTMFRMEETSKSAGNIDPRQNIPPINSGVSGVQSVVTSEQVAKLSHLSASLSQLFGNGQQLPQLYATLNPTSSLGLVPSHPNTAGVGAPFAGSFPPSEQGAWSQKQYDPVSSGMESSQITKPQGFSEKNTIEHEPQAPLQSSVPSSLGGGLDGSDPAKNVGLEKTLDHESNGMKQLESGGNEKAAEAVVREQGTAHSGDPNADSHMDEDGKRSKDSKGMRMFKFALVEFVKEVLKPTWKEGQLSKEAHKTVVKKVVDKVTSSVQGDHIPQTQERIDQYLAYSKTKLTKLVEAYVEKYVKA